MLAVAAGASYQVQRGDTWESVAAKNGITVQQLADLNPLTAGTQLNVPGSTPTPVPAPQPAQTAGLALGAYNARVGTVQAYFDGWTDSPSCAPAGQTTFIYWENYGYSLDSIINGTQDNNIRSFASAICPGTTLALFHEMDGNWDSWDGTVGSNTPTKVIQAYQHIHDIIGSKVKYAWVVNDSDVPDRAGNRPANYWPGSAYVDIIGVDGFDWDGHTTFMQAIAPNYDVVKSYGKPVWITSVGTVSNRASWITDALAQAKANGVAGLIYYDSNDGGSFQLGSSALSAFHL